MVQQAGISRVAEICGKLAAGVALAITLALTPGVGSAAETAPAAGQSNASQTSATAEKLSTRTRENEPAGFIYTIPIEPMDVAGATTSTSLMPYKGKVLLIVNVASKCGFTKQYAGLEDLYEKYKDQGLVVLGFPSNDFKGQEPGTEKEILEFCQGRFGVSFPMFAKIHVTGEHMAPLYKYLTKGRGEISWNFNKFLVDREGRVVSHLDSKVAPEDPVLVQQIKVLLAQ